jgi:hypothetical protein
LSDETLRATLIAAWCRTCGTQHPPETLCRRQVEATGPEFLRWRVSALSPEGVRGHGVLAARAGALWRSRIITFPNVLWMVPGGGETIKFMAQTEDDAVRQAVDFIRRHCVSKGHLMRDEIEPVETPTSAVAVTIPRDPALRNLPRYERRLPVQFGRSRPSILAHTGNLSESGLFVVTPTPLTDGELLGLLLELEHCKLPLRASVAWRRTQRAPRRDSGMGVSLVNPPSSYVSYVRALA